MAGADPLSTVVLTSVLTAASHLVRTYTQTRAKNNGVTMVAEIKDRAALTGELWKRVEKLEKDHGDCEQKHTECLIKVAALTDKIERLETRVAHIDRG